MKQLFDVLNAKFFRRANASALIMEKEIEEFSSHEINDFLLTNNLINEIEKLIWKDIVR